MKRVLNIIDSFDYVNENCFQHQLIGALRAEGVKTMEVNQVLMTNGITGYDRVIISMRQRTLRDMAHGLKLALGDVPVVVYDQDPWEAFRDHSLHLGAYDRIRSELNVKAFAVTTSWWANFLYDRGYPTTFVKMWVRPDYCDASPAFIERNVPVGFIGSLHPYRRELFDWLDDMGINVIVQPRSIDYADFLQSLSNMQIFIHSEDAPITVQGEPANLNVGLWIKDVEAASRGCFSIRNQGEGSYTYLQRIGTVRLYDDPAEIPGIIDDIQKMDPGARQGLIDDSVDYIRQADHWKHTAQRLITC